MGPYKVKVEGIPTPGVEGADLLGQTLTVVAEGHDYVTTDDGSVWTVKRHGSYNVAVRGPMSNEQPYQELLRLVRTEVK
jgi:hypothetical protein